jgi:hypothetical protein
LENHRFNIKQISREIITKEAKLLKSIISVVGAKFLPHDTLNIR